MRGLEALELLGGQVVLPGRVVDEVVEFQLIRFADDFVALLTGLEGGSIPRVLISPDYSRRVGQACASQWWACGNGNLTQFNVLQQEIESSHAPAHRMAVSLSHPTSS